LLVDKSRSSIYDIVGYRELDGWAPGYEAPYHRRSVGAGIALIGLGAGLLLAVWARWRH